MVVGVGIPHKDICPLLKQWQHDSDLADSEARTVALAETRVKMVEFLRARVSR